MAGGPGRRHHRRRERPNPTITASPGYDVNAASIGLNPALSGVSFDVPIETMGKRGYRKAKAQHLSESARLNIASTAWQVRANLRATLIDFAVARQRMALLQNQSGIQEKIVQSLQERVKAGAASGTELSLVQIAFQKNQLDLADARRQEADTRVRVADAIGISAAALDGLEIAYDLSGIPPATNLMSAEVRGQALRSRADVLGALADYAASQSALQLEIAKQFPDVHLGPLYQYNQGDNQFTLNISAELPVLNQHQGAIAEAEARRTEAAARFNALQAKVISDIDRAVAAYRVTAENLAAIESLAAAQKKQSDAVAAQAEAGAADQLDVLNSKVEMAASQLVELDGWTKAQQSFAALEAAVQRPLETITPATVEQPPQAMKENHP